MPVHGHATENSGTPRTRLLRAARPTSEASAACLQRSLLADTPNLSGYPSGKLQPRPSPPLSADALPATLLRAGVLLRYRRAWYRAWRYGRPGGRGSMGL